MRFKEEWGKNTECVAVPLMNEHAHPSPDNSSLPISHATSHSAKTDHPSFKLIFLHFTDRKAKADNGWPTSVLKAFQLALESFASFCCSGVHHFDSHCRSSFIFCTFWALYFWNTQRKSGMLKTAQSRMLLYATLLWNICIISPLWSTPAAGRGNGSNCRDHNLKEELIFFKASKTLLVGGDSSMVRAPDSWLKGCGFESLQEQRENFLLRCWLLIRYSSGDA